MNHRLLSTILFLAFWQITVALPKVVVGNKEVLLKRGTTVSLILAEDVASTAATTQKNKSVELEVKVNVVVDGEVVIRTGAYAEGYIDDIKRRRGFGRDAVIVIRPQNVQTVDEQRIIVAGGELKAKKTNGRKGLAIALLIGIAAVALLFALLTNSFWVFLIGALLGLALSASVKGNSVVAPMNETITTHVDKDIYIKIPTATRY